MSRLPRLLIALLFVCIPAFSTTVAQRLLKADGTAYTGRFRISWPTYVNASGTIVRSGYVTVILESDGDFSVSLAPHINSPASGPIYTVDYNELRQGTRQTEYWDVPDTMSTLEIADVLTVAPATSPSSISSLPNLSIVGTITTGVWNATAIGAAIGGTGDDTSATTGIPYIVAGNWQYNTDVSNTELGYVNGVTSAIQTQLDGKLPLAGGTVTGQVAFVPASGAYAADLQKSGSSGTLRVYDQTASTGATSIAVIAGAGQSATNLMLMQGSTYQGIWDAQGQFSGGVIATGKRLVTVSAQVPGMALGSGGIIEWKDAVGLDDPGSFDTGLARNAAGVVEVNNGTPGTFRDLILRKLNATGLTSYANNAAAIVGGLVAGDLYTVTGSDPLQVAIVF